MNKQRQTKSAPNPTLTPLQTRLHQRTCACGGAAGTDGLCSECRDRKFASPDSASIGLDLPQHNPPFAQQEPHPVEQATIPGSISSRPFFGHDFSHVQVHAAAPEAIQTKLTVNQPADPYEQEAEQVAEQAMRISETESVQRAGYSSDLRDTRIQRMSPQDEEEEGEAEELSNEPIEEEKEETLQARVSPGHTPAVTPELHARIHALRGGSQPLDAATRAFMEPRFGHDFSKVRIHTDERAAQTARTVNAVAYTVGRDVVFGAGQYAPDTTVGKHLLAHELTHVVQQQSSGGSMLARQKVTRHETEAVLIKKKHIEEIAGRSYWMERVGKVYRLVFPSRVTGRFKANPEERDAVLSTLWKVRPTGKLTGEITRIVSIPGRPRSRPSKPAKSLLYQFTFKPKPTAKDKNSVEVSFMAEGGAAEVVSASPPPPDYRLPKLPREGEDFPEGMDAYWKKYPDEQKQLYNWIEHSAGRSFEKVVTTRADVTQGKKTVTHSSSFFVKGAKDAKGKVTSLNIKFMGTLPITQETPPPDYRSKDIADFLLEEAQTTPDPKKGDRLGNITGLKPIPADELVSIKYVIESYFRSGTRNAEVDTIVPIAQTNKQVFYTLRFRAGTGPKTVDVDVVRVGEKKTATSGKIDPTRLDITRVKGYADNATDPTKLQSWLKKRYPGVPISGSTVQEITRNMNTLMQSRVEADSWFSSNYGIKILDGSSGATRLKTVHGFNDAQLVDIKTFQPGELRMLELALETLSDTLLPTLRNVQMVRQEISIEEEKEGSGKFRPEPERGGFAHGKGAQKTVIIFDKAFSRNDYLFLGSVGNVLPESVGTYIHEFGHIVARSSPALEKAFKDFVKKKHIQPVTKYAATKPKKGYPESFPEAFALYNADPQWMKTNLPDLYDWFEKLAKPR